MNLIKNEAGRYEVRFKGPDGKIKSKSTGKTDKQEALKFIEDSKIEELERAAELGILTQDVVSMLINGRKVTVESAIESWEIWMKEQHLSSSHIYSMVTWARAWARHMGLEKRTISSVTRKEIGGWLNDPKLPNKVGTRRVMHSAMKSLFGFASACGMVMGNEAQLVRIDIGQLSHEQKETEKRPCFTDSEVALLLAACAPGAPRESAFWHAAIAIGRWTGLRLGDIARLEWDSFKLPGRIVVWTIKRDKRVELPLEPDALRKAVASLPMEDERYVFPHQRMVISCMDLRATLSNQFKSIADYCRIEGKTFHCLRATYISECFKNGTPMEHIAKAVGHSETETTQGYIRTSD